MIENLSYELRNCFGGAHKIPCHLATVDKNNGDSPEIRTITLMEKDWHFYIETSLNSRKAHEILTHPKVAGLIPLKKDKYQGYLRFMGKINSINDILERQNIGDFCDYPTEQYWNGYSDPDLFFLEITIERIELMIPGEFKSIDVTLQYKRLLTKE